MRSRHADRGAAAERLRGIDRMLRNVESGRFERSLSALTAAGALVTAAEIYFEHDSASFGNNYSQCDNDRALMRAAQGVMEDILRAAGADEVITIQRYAHLVGGARMAEAESRGVVDRNCRSFAVPNLYITDGSVLPTQGSANPALTIMAVAARAADQLAAGARSAG
jgi:choline dehydrogenase-like flavoprotein